MSSFVCDCLGVILFCFIFAIGYLVGQNPENKLNFVGFLLCVCLMSICCTLFYLSNLYFNDL